MDLIKSPTDLYKFLAIGGIVVAASCIIFPVFFYHRTSMEYLAQLRTSAEYQVHEKFTKERVATLDKRKQQVEVEQNELKAQLKELNPGSKVVGNSAEGDKLKHQIEELNRQIQSIEEASHELSLNLDLRRENAKYEETVSTNRRRDSRVALEIGALIALLGLLVSVFGFANWWKWMQTFQLRSVAEEAEPQLQARSVANGELEQATPQQLQARTAAIEVEAQLQAKAESLTNLSKPTVLEHPPK